MTTLAQQIKYPSLSEMLSLAEFASRKQKQNLEKQAINQTMAALQQKGITPENPRYNMMLYGALRQKSQELGLPSSAEWAVKERSAVKNFQNYAVNAVNNYIRIMESAERMEPWSKGVLHSQLKSIYGDDIIPWDLGQIKFKKGKVEMVEVNGTKYFKKVDPRGNVVFQEIRGKKEPDRLKVLNSIWDRAVKKVRALGLPPTEETVKPYLEREISFYNKVKGSNITLSDFSARVGEKYQGGYEMGKTYTYSPRTGFKLEGK